MFALYVQDMQNVYEVKSAHVKDVVNVLSTIDDIGHIAYGSYGSYTEDGLGGGNGEVTFYGKDPLKIVVRPINYIDMNKKDHPKCGEQFESILARLTALENRLQPKRKKKDIDYYRYILPKDIKHQTIINAIEDLFKSTQVEENEYFINMGIHSFRVKVFNGGYSFETDNTKVIHDTFRSALNDLIDRYHRRNRT